MKFASTYETKKKIVQAGESRIFNDWVKHSKVTQEEFLDGLQWLCGDPCDERNRLTRELGLTPDGVVKLQRVYDTKSGVCAFYLDGFLWSGALFEQELSERDKELSGKDTDFFVQKICISAADNI